MRVFWIMIAVVALAAVGAIGYTFTRQQAALESLARAQVAQARAAEKEASLAAEIVASESEKEKLQALAAVPPTAPPSQTPAAAPTTTVPPSAPASVPAPAPQPAPPPAPITEAAPVTAPRTTTPAPASATPDEAAPAAAATTKIGEYDVAPGSIVRNPDGTLLVDGKYTIKGSGTAADPYQITWELLTSVVDTFDPKGGKKKLPERVAMLQKKHVRIAGHISFPMMVQEPRECLAMLNQWDGCCIGVPPTPYDALEVTLAKPASGNNRFAIAGTVTGIFETKPYVMGDWLVGLYLLNGAKLEPSDYGAGAGN